MKERPVLMHAKSINGILEGRKTQTRRIVKPRPDVPWKISPIDDEWLVEGWPKQERAMQNFGRAHRIRCPYGKPGDQLWVRETFAISSVDGCLVSIARKERMPEGKTLADTDGGLDQTYLENLDEVRTAERLYDPFLERWRPSIFMPRWACRLTLEIINIRVERVQSISEEDCFAEGVRILDEIAPYKDCPNYRIHFHELWDETNGKGAWQKNDWCWVLSFKRVEA